MIFFSFILSKYFILCFDVVVLILNDLNKIFDTRKGKDKISGFEK